MSSLSEILRNKTVENKTNISENQNVEPIMMALDDAPITRASDFWRQHSSYKYFSTFSDNNHSEITENKDIILNNLQFNISQEENSQYIPFEMPRYYDGYDLTKATLSIHYETASGLHASVRPVNVMYNDDRIKFGWLVDAGATSDPGELKFEIHAYGSLTDSSGQMLGYVWKTKPNTSLKVEKSLCNCEEVSNIIDDSWVQDLISDIAQNVADEIKNVSIADQVASAEQSALRAEQAANSIINKLDNYYTKTDTFNKTEINSLINGIDGLAKFGVTYNGTLMNFYNGSELMESIKINSDPSEEWTSAYNEVVNSKISDATTPISTALNSFKEKTDKDLSEIHKNIDDLPQTLKTQYYDKFDTDALLASKATKTEVAEIGSRLSNTQQTADSNKTSIATMSTKLSSLEEIISKIDTDPNKTYDITKSDTEEMYILWEIEHEGLEDEIRTEKSRFVAGGTGSGGGTSSVLKIEYVTKSPLTVTTNDKAIIKYNFSGVDSSGDEVTEGKYVWKMNNRVIATGIATSGENSFDASDFISVGTQKLVLSITDDAGSLATKSWSIQKVDIRIDSDFNDKLTYPLGEVSLNYTPYGAIPKTIHFKIDGTEIGTVNTASSGIPTSYTLPSQSHGAHLVEMYITATVNNAEIETNHIYKDIIWYDPSSSIPVIGCVSNNLTVQQYDAINITYTVFDPTTETPEVTLAVDGKTVSVLTLDNNTQIWQYKATEIGNRVLTIMCGQTVKTINVIVEELDIDVSPVTAGLEFDFNPVGRSNNDSNRVWSDEASGVTMSVSENFDWINGGYQIDKNGDQYFCVKSGTTATINYNLFADDPKRNGKEFKVIFKTTRVKNRKTSFITCMENNIGLDMQIESANVYSSNDSLYSPYCEDDIIEFEFNINKNTDIPMVLTYEDGTANRPMIYTSDASFMQSNPQPITIGSKDCDVYIYRMKGYSSSLSDIDIRNNYIADARNAEDMIARYKENQIYDENGALTPEVLAEKRPDLKVIMIDAPWFTNDKSNKVSDTTITMIHKNGDPILDNWTCIGAQHSGQGTSSNEYGYSGRNIDLIMNKEESLFTLGDGVTTAKTITLSRTSVPTNYLNVKVNIASSENENNAQFAKRYNEYNPFKRTAKLKDSRVKDTMEFYNCVVFIRENNEDILTHREFMDTNWHFYAIGNVGDSKKTDNTRVNDENDPKECIIEITDYNVALAEFPTGKVDEFGNKIICPESEWKVGNAAYDYLYAPYKYKDGEFSSFGSESYEFRYEKKGITEEERQVNIDAWRDFYKFVVTSDDEKFKTEFEKYFVKDSALYFYLFTERYEMVDNRAKNSFWHYGKVWYSEEEAERFKAQFNTEIESKYINDTQATFNEGYRWDLAFAYDMDTSLGIDNTGKLVLTYGKEDTDYYTDGDPTSAYIYRAAESTFFCRVRDLFPSELQAMFVNCENANAWSADSLISQWDKAQEEFSKELVRLDIQRKYFRTYQGISIDNSIAGTANPRFLTEMLNGLKKYQRRMFERNQELYMATKYFGNRATQDQIMMRFNNPVNIAIKPNFTLKITPYSDMYIGVKFGNVAPINMRAKAGIEYTVPYSLDTADITLIYGASFIQAIGDLSKCYVGDNDFSKASRLQSLVIGSNVEGYYNSYMTKISLGNNDLLEYLDIRNITGLNTVVDLSQCNNLLELHAEGSGATGVIFSNGGKLQKAYLPSISSLTIKNLNNIEVFNVDSYDNLLSLIVENTPFLDTYEIVNNAKKLNVLRLIGVQWGEDYHFADSSILDRLLTIRGVGNDGYETAIAMITGYFYSAVIKQKNLETYKNAWKNLEINYGTLITQFEVRFLNDNGEVLDVQYVDKGAMPIDPITRKDNPIKIPTKESSISSDFTFKSWDQKLYAVFNDQTYIATYTESTRNYTVRYLAKGIIKQTITAPYGTYVEYTGDIPTYTTEEAGYKYYLFKGWDQSGYVNGNKDINAVYDSCEYVSGYFEGKDISELRPVELYAITKLGKESELCEIKDNVNITFGQDCDYSDIESKELIKEETVFTGENYIDTGIKLLDEDRDFVLAIDYNIYGGNNFGVIAQCYQSDGAFGFKLYKKDSTYNGMTWGTSSTNVSSYGNRDIVVVRHVKGELGLHVYKGSLLSNAPEYIELSKNRESLSNIATLVFGCAKADDGEYENYAQGKIYWAKLWYADLGDLMCKKLASWTHDSYTMNVCGFKRYYLSDGSSKRSTISFLGNNVLSDIRTCLDLDSTKGNIGGYAETSIRTWLNERLYKGISIEWQQLIKQVKIISTVGGNSSETSSSDNFMYLPSLAELNNGYDREPYSFEGSPIAYFTSNQDRIITQKGGEKAVDYLTRSPQSTSSTYWYYVDSEGRTQTYNYVNNNRYVLFGFSI